MKYGIGDILVCKKDVNDPFTYYKFKVGNYYHITEISQASITVEGLHFSLYYKDIEIYKYFYDHFYTLEEVRKFKLERLKCVK